jgi:DNA-binding LacI/PurR family transcriptional regulator
MIKKKHANLVDVAKRAGVSRSTVSRVINHDPNVNEETRAKVLNIIDLLGYVPNTAARMLRSQNARIIGIVVPDVVRNVFVSDNPDYYALVLQATAEVCRTRDYAMLLWLNDAEESKETYFKRILANRVIDAIVIIASMETDSGLIDALSRSNLPFVLVGRPFTGSQDAHFVTVDNVGAAKKAVHHLIDVGAKRIAHITGSLSNVDGFDRFEGYRLGLQEAGMRYDPNLVYRGVFTYQTGYDGMKALLAKGKVDGLFAGSDLIAKGAIDYMKELGLCAPNDIAIVGFDDRNFALETDPPLTTIRQPITGKAAQATAMAIDLVEGKQDVPKVIILGTELILRESTRRK